MMNYVVLTYFAIGLLLFVFGFLADSKPQTWARAGLFILACLGIRPGILGEEFGAIGAVLFIPFLWSLFSSKIVLSSSPKASVILLCLIFIWESFSTGFSDVFFSAQAMAVAIVVFLSSLEFSRDPRIVQTFFKLGFTLVIWQTAASFPSYILPNEFVLSNSIQLGRDWTYLTNALGANFVGSSMEFASALKLIGISTFESLPRLTMFWGEPGIAALFVVLLASIDLRFQKRWRAKIQLPLVAAILSTQSFGGLFVYLVVSVSALFLLNQTVEKAGRSTLRRFAIIGFSVAVSQLLFVQSQSKFGASSVSLTDRTGERGALESLMQIAAAPLGSGSSGGINLIQAGVNSGLPTLILGLMLFLVIPLLQTRRLGFSPLFLVPMLAATFIQPPFLPIWFVFLGIYWGNLVNSNEPISKGIRPLTDLIT
jgi:hypothetical protein